MKVEGSYIYFETGKKLYANCGIVGISPDLLISEGFDGDLDADDLTPAERQELAVFMADLWTQFGNVSTNNSDVTNG